MALTYPARSQVGLGVPGTLSTTINSSDSVGATFSSGTALTDWVDISGANFANPVELAVDYDPGDGTSHTEEKIEATVNVSSGVFTIVRRMIDWPAGTAPTPPSHSPGVSIVPIWTAEEVAEFGAAVQLLKTTLLNSGENTSPGNIAVGAGPASNGTSPFIASGDHDHVITSAVLKAGVIATGLALPQPTSQSANYNANAGDMVMATQTLTITLPTPAQGIYVGAFADYSATHATAVTLSSASEGGFIIGAGVAASSQSVVLGTQNAKVILVSDGTNWFIAAGEQDTGWIGFSYSNSWASVSGPYGGTAAGYRLVGNVVRLGGKIGSGATGNAFATVPSAYKPTYGALFFPIITNSAPTPPVAGTMELASGGALTPVFTSGTVIPLDGITWTVN